MTSKTVPTVATFGILAVIAVASFLMPEILTTPSVRAAAAPGTIVLNGVVRDFTTSHVDFGIATMGSPGHYAGSINFWLSGDRIPLLVSGGYKVDGQWRDSSSRPIAPHMAGMRSGLQRDTLGLRVNDTIELRSEAMIDAFNSNYGPYGVMGNYGAEAFLSTNSTGSDAITIDSKCVVKGDIEIGAGGSPATVVDNKGIVTGTILVQAEMYEIPEITPPEDLQGYVATMTITGSTTLSGDTTPDDLTDDPALHVGNFTIAQNAILTVEGDLRIRCDGSFKIDKGQIRLLPEANLSVFVTGLTGSGDVELKGETLVNVDVADTTLVTINALGTGKLECSGKSHVYATIIAPLRRLDIKSESQFYGGFVGDALKVDSKGAAFHVDNGNAELGDANFAITVREKIEIKNNSVIDCFDSDIGPYGGANVGAYAWISTNSVKDDEVKIDGSTVQGDVLVGAGGNPSKVIQLSGGGTIGGAIGTLGMPVAIPVVAPPAMGASVGDLTYNGGTHTISADLRCKNMKIESGAIVWITGDVTIRCDDKIEMKGMSEIRLNPGATLTLYVKKDLKLDDSCKINMNTGDPKLVSIRRTSVGKNGKIEIKKNSQLCAWVQGAKTELQMDESEFFGSFTGKKVKIESNSRLHVDMSGLSNCTDMLDTPGTAGVVDNGGIDSAGSFTEWFRNVLGVNQTIAHPITLSDNGSGVYEYLSDDFFPIDDMLLGNEGEAHNYLFSYTIGAEFVYQDCAGQFIEFTGGDGAWLFVNGQLVMDLGGVGPVDSQYVQIDRLGLADGKSYQLRFFFAERRTTESVFRLRTNLELASDRAVPSITAMFD